MTVQEFRDVIQSTVEPYLLIDVRPELETSICRLPDSVSLPYECLEERTDELKKLVSQHLPDKTGQTLPGNINIAMLMSAHT